MIKNIENTEYHSELDDYSYSDLPELTLDDEYLAQDFELEAEQIEQIRGKRKKDARRLLEQRREERELQKRLDEVYN